MNNPEDESGNQMFLNAMARQKYKSSKHEDFK